MEPANTDPPANDFGWRDRLLALGEKYASAGEDLAALIPSRTGEGLESPRTPDFSGPEWD
jgi:hypothetical protein